MSRPSLRRSPHVAGARVLVHLLVCVGIAAVLRGATKDLGAASTSSAVTIRFMEEQAQVLESEDDIRIHVTRSGGRKSKLTMPYVLSGSAKVGMDYEKLAGGVTFEANQSTAEMAIDLRDDGATEGSETIVIILKAPTGVTIGTPSKVAVTILDDEVIKSAADMPKGPTPHAVSFNAVSYGVLEKEGAGLITVLRQGGSGSAVNVKYATQDDTAKKDIDYSATGGTLSFGPKDIGRVFTVRVKDNTKASGNKKLKLVLKDPTGGAQLGVQREALLMIIDDELAKAGTGTLQFGEKKYAVSEDQKEAVISVVRVGGLRGTISVGYATADDSAKAGSDYLSVSGRLTFLPNETGKTFTVPIIHDGTNEQLETIFLRLSSPSRGTRISGPPEVKLQIK